MIDKKDFVINGKTFYVTKFPAFDGISIMTRFPMSSIPKLGDHKIMMDTVAQILNYVYVPMPNNESLRLSTIDLIDAHVPDWETGLKIVGAMVEHNCSFFQDGRLSNFLENLEQSVQTWSTKTLVPLLERLFQSITRPSQN